MLKSFPCSGLRKTRELSLEQLPNLILASELISGQGEAKVTE